MYTSIYPKPCQPPSQFVSDSAVEDPWERRRLGWHHPLRMADHSFPPSSPTGAPGEHLFPTSAPQNLLHADSQPEGHGLPKEGLLANYSMLSTALDEGCPLASQVHRPLLSPWIYSCQPRRHGCRLRGRAKTCRLPASLHRHRSGWTRRCGWHSEDSCQAIINDDPSKPCV